VIESTIKAEEKAREEKANAVEKGTLQILKFNISIANIAESFNI
jgi:hypothetical protein